MQDSFLQTDDTGKIIAYIGPDATRLFQARALKCALELFAKTGMIPTRGIGRNIMLIRATGITGLTYPKSPAGVSKAIRDLNTWMLAMQSALPVKTQNAS